MAAEGQWTMMKCVHGLLLPERDKSNCSLLGKIHPSLRNHCCLQMRWKSFMTWTGKQCVAVFRWDVIIIFKASYKQAIQWRNNHAGCLIYFSFIGVVVSSTNEAVLNYCCWSRASATVFKQNRDCCCHLAYKYMDL